MPHTRKRFYLLRCKKTGEFAKSLQTVDGTTELVTYPFPRWQVAWRTVNYADVLASQAMLLVLLGRSDFEVITLQVHLRFASGPIRIIHPKPSTR